MWVQEALHLPVFPPLRVGFIVRIPTWEIDCKTTCILRGSAIDSGSSAEALEHGGLL
jgi:hypothetical protein